MDRIFVDVRKRNLTLGVAVSIVIHILLLLSYYKYGDFVLFRIPPKLDDETIILELADSSPNQRIREIIESPEASRIEKPVENADLASDKNAMARDLNDNINQLSNIPYSRGLADLKEVPRQAGDDMKQPGEQESDQSNQASDHERTYEKTVVADARSSSFSRDKLLGISKPPSSYQPSVYKQEKSSVEHSGGISFNTYNWKFAPYLLELKRRIQRNMYPPPAFSRLGLGGENVMRFRIYPDGRLEGPELIQSKGENALVETSRKAITFSAPFPELPEDFPENYLEVTATFYYFIQ